MEFKLYISNRTKFICIALLCSIGCESVSEQVIPDNDAFSETGISKIKIENYVNRLFIDIVAREPTDEELDEYTDSLNTNDLSKDIRFFLIDKLMMDSTYSPNEGSYKQAYAQNLYLLAKIRCLEGVADSEFARLIGIARQSARIDSITEDWEGYFKSLNTIRRLELCLESRDRLLAGYMEYHEMFAFMIDNGIYDEINMNSFNFIRATYDQLFFRLPTDQEFDAAFDMVDSNMENVLMGRFGRNKSNYIDIIIQSEAMLEGMIRWSYQVFLQRSPLAEEVTTLLNTYKINRDINFVIRSILVTDEYANFL